MKPSKDDQLFIDGLDKLSDSLRKEYLEGRIMKTKSQIKALALDTRIKPKSIIAF